MPLPKLGIHLILPSLIQSFQLFLVVISRGLSVAVILFHSLKLFTSPSSFVFIPNQPAVSSLCIALSSVLLHLILALRTSPPRVTVEGSRFLPPYKQYCMFVLFGLTCIPYGVACHALFRYPGLDDKRHEHIINTVVLLHALLVEVRSLPRHCHEHLLITSLSLRFYHSHSHSRPLPLPYLFLLFHLPSDVQEKHGSLWHARPMDSGIQGSS